MSYIPNHLWHIIFDFYGRIKYIGNKGIFINIIHKYDERYDIVNRFLQKKIKYMENSFLDTNRNEFYLEIPFETINNIGIVFDFCWSYHNTYEICHYNFRNPNQSLHLQQMRIYIK